jgi:predicted ester cyclase
MVTSDYHHYVVTSTGFRALSWDQFRKGNQAAHKASPDWKISPLQIVVEGDRAAVLLIGRGTHVGSFAGEKPTGRSIALPITIFHQVRDGRLVADWEIADAAPLLETLTVDSAGRR